MIYLIANWKMNPTTQQQANELLSGISKGLAQYDENVRAVLCVPTVYLALATQVMQGTADLGVQNCFYESEGAFTGEVSPLMVSDSGCKYVIVGHSERRAMGENNEIVQKKVKQILETTDMTPIVAVGYTEQKTELEQEKNIVQEQVEQAFSNLSHQDAERILVAYEPVWAIGTGTTPTPEHIQHIKQCISNTLNAMHSNVRVPVLYGGSTNQNNCVECVQDAQTDGLLVGGSSLESNEFLAMFNNLRQISTR